MIFCLVFGLTVLAQFFDAEARAGFGVKVPRSRRLLTFTRRSLLTASLADGAGAWLRGWFVV